MNNNPIIEVKENKQPLLYVKDLYQGDVFIYKNEDIQGIYIICEVLPLLEGFIDNYLLCKLDNGCMFTVRDSELDEEVVLVKKVVVEVCDGYMCIKTNNTKG